MVAEKGELLFGFDALRHNHELQGVRHGDDGPDDRGVLRVACHVAHERLIELDSIDGESLEVVERGVSSSEIVQRYRYAEPLELQECVDRELGVLHRARFGDLEIE